MFFADKGERVSNILFNYFNDRYLELITEGMEANPPPERIKGTRGKLKKTYSRNLLERMQSHQVEIFSFLHDNRVPFDNNQAGVTRSRVLDCLSAIPSIRDVPISAGFSGNGIVRNLSDNVEELSKPVGIIC